MQGHGPHWGHGQRLHMWPMEPMGSMGSWGHGSHVGGAQRPPPQPTKHNPQGGGGCVHHQSLVVQSIKNLLIHASGPGPAAPHTNGQVCHGRWPRPSVRAPDPPTRRGAGGATMPERKSSRGISLTKWLASATIKRTLTKH